MKLIYAKGACSLSVHILLEEIGLPYESVRVSLEDKKVLDSYNPKSYVPALELESGEVLTEATNLLQYISLENGGCFMPASLLERARCMEWLTFISTELHKGMGPLFHKSGLKEEYLKEAKQKLNSRLTFLEENLSRNKFIMGPKYTIADMYALAILRIGEHVGLDYDDFPSITVYKSSLEAKDTINNVIRAETKAAIATEPRNPFQKLQKSQSVNQDNLN